MKNITLILLVAGILISCKDKEQASPETTQMETVMAIHDEVMPKMGKLGQLVAELKPMVDSTETGLRYKSAMIDLQDAHTAMMDWMQGFGERFDHDEIMNGKELTAQKKEWLNEEEEKVKTLRQQINSSIERAESLLNNQ